MSLGAVRSSRGRHHAELGLAGLLESVVAIGEAHNHVIMAGVAYYLCLESLASSTDPVKPPLPSCCVYVVLKRRNNVVCYLLLSCSPMLSTTKVDRAEMHLGDAIWTPAPGERAWRVCGTICADRVGPEGYGVRDKAIDSRGQYVIGNI
jgi:hypothetical protein